MKKKSNKYSLLNKEEPQEYEMIELEDLSQRKKAENQEDIIYQKLDQNPIHNANQSHPQNSQPQYQQPQPQFQNQQPQARQSQMRYSQPTVYHVQRSWLNDFIPPVTVNINPRRPPSVNVQKPKGLIPDMKVACEKCTYEQTVPGNTQVYVCCMCNEMNECYPLYGLFICCRCHSNVCYPYGTSEFIKCTKCSTVNKVPSEPQKNYSSQNKKKEEASQKIEEKREEKEFEIYEEEELDFQEVPKPKENENRKEDLQYPSMD